MLLGSWAACPQPPSAFSCRLMGALRKPPPSLSTHECQLSALVLLQSAMSLLSTGAQAWKWGRELVSAQ